MGYDYIIQELIRLKSETERLIREVEEMKREGGNAAPIEFPHDPLAKSTADLVTPKQLGLIRSLAREAALDSDEECQKVMRCQTEELSKRAASSFIDHLKTCVSAFHQARKAS